MKLTKMDTGNEPLHKDVFVITVDFRSHGTWQGGIRWKGGGENVKFRSALEMLKIMDKALEQSHPEDTT